MKSFIDHNVTIFTPVVTENENEALKIAFDVLGDIQSLFKDDIDLVSIETGEVVTIEELHRVRGILDAFYHNHHWKVQGIED